MSRPQATQKNINLEILRTLRVPVPPIGLQDAFSSQVKKLRSLAHSQFVASSLANYSFQSLLAGVFGTPT